MDYGSSSETIAVFRQFNKYTKALMTSLLNCDM